MTLFSLNWLLGALIVITYCGFPVWLVLRQRGTNPQTDALPHARISNLAGPGPEAAPITALSVQRDAA
jgi:hypothetical protein